MTGKTKEKAARKVPVEQNKSPDRLPAADRGYYYDDAHGYEPYVPDDEDEGADQPPQQDQLSEEAIDNPS